MELPPELEERLQALTGLRLVFFAGMPATGKSTLVRVLAGAAHRSGRDVHLLQWDVARPAFEASEPGQRFPQVDHVTDPLIRRAVGLWARAKVADWDRSAPNDAILIGETPFIGGRLVELAHRGDNVGEEVLRQRNCRFVLVVPSNTVRRHIEAERERRASAPANAGEREEAPPHLLNQMWLDLLEAATALGVEASDGGGTDSFEAGTYRRAYERLLRHRPFEVLPVDEVLDVAEQSAYDFDFPVTPLLPSKADCAAYISLAERETMTTPPWWEV